MSDDEVQIINTKKCLLFLSTAELAWVEELASEVKGKLTTFLVNGEDRMPTSLANYLFKQTLNDTVIITDMSIPKGYKMPKALSESTKDEVLLWVNNIEQNAEIFNSVDKFEKELKQLVGIFEKKASLTSQQESHVQLKADLDSLKSNMLSEISAVPEKLRGLQDKCGELRKTLTTMEVLFGTPVDFECVNNAGETKSISDLLGGRSHLLIYFSAHWCPPCRGFTPVLAQA